MAAEAIFSGTAVAIDGRAVLIEGEPGSGKSSLALALIEDGAVLIGDDGVRLSRSPQGQILASPPPNIAGLLEIRGVGLVTLPTAAGVPAALILQLGSSPEPKGDRLPEALGTRTLLGAHIPALPFTPGPWAPAARARWALRVHGI